MKNVPVQDDWNACGIGDRDKVLRQSSLRHSRRVVIRRHDHGGVVAVVCSELRQLDSLERTHASGTSDQPDAAIAIDGAHLRTDMRQERSLLGLSKQRELAIRAHDAHAVDHAMFVSSARAEPAREVGREAR